jgi:hypothetical protein
VQLALVIRGDAPNRPAAHMAHDPAPERLYCPAGHGDVVALVDPAGHAYPAVQSPLHPDVFIAAVAPNCPAAHALQVDAPALLNCPEAHSLHVDAPALLNCPAGQVDTVALVDPAGHVYPEVQSPLHADVFIAGVAPYRPAAHAVHGFIRPRLNLPVGQGWHPSLKA